MFKRVTCIIVALLSFIQSAYAYDIVNLPHSTTFADALGIFSQNSIVSATISDIDRNICKPLSREDINEFCSHALSMTVWRKINPTPFRGVSVNFTTADGRKISYYYNSGIQIGTYGSDNFVCYMTTSADTQTLSFLMSEFYDNADNAQSGAESSAVTDKDFLKLPSQAWAKETVAQAAGKSLVPYEFTNKYEKNITREELAILICNFIAVAGNYASIDAYMKATGTDYRIGSFRDCAGRDEAIDCLYALGIIGGVDGVNFNPDGLVTRQEAAAFMSRTAKLFMYVNTSYSTKTADWGKVAGWATFHMRWCMDKGLLLVDDSNKIYPTDNMTIQQAITVLSRLYDIATYWES